jgi:hypothetical protein
MSANRIKIKLVRAPLFRAFRQSGYESVFSIIESFISRARICGLSFDERQGSPSGELLVFFDF